MRIYLMSSADAGFADFVELDDGATIKDLWDKTNGLNDPSKFVIRVSREAGEGVPEIPTGRLPADFALVDGDRVTVTPHKVAGAEEAGFLA